MISRNACDALKLITLSLLLLLSTIASASDYQDYELANEDANEEDEAHNRTTQVYDYENCGRAPLNPLTKRGSLRSNNCHNATSQQRFMTHGTRQLYGEWPSYVRLETLLSFTQFRSCGGVIISNWHILTAAHCVVKALEQPNEAIEARSVTAILAEDRIGPQVDAHEKRVGIRHICLAPDFRARDVPHTPIGGEVTHDYAILTTSEEIPFNDHIQPACLPTGHQEPINDPRAVCYLVGTGVKSYNGSKSVYVKTVEKQSMKQASCSTFRISDDDESRSCWTKQPGRGTACKGDSGGPILCLNKQTKRWTVAALPSYGPRNCGGSRQWLAVYTRVGRLLPRIKESCSI